MLKIPYAKQQESQIKIAESQITNIDKNIIKILQLFSVTGQLDLEIENIRLELAENQHFYPEALFSYLKSYNNQQQVTNETASFFDFSSIQQQSPLIINAINSAKDGIIPFDNLIKFLKHHQKCEVQVETLKILERQLHVNQFAYKQNEVIDTNNNQYPLPKDVLPNLPQNKQNVVQGSTKVPLMQQANQEIVNSGEGFNYVTFQKMIISQSIPLAKQKVSKRKLIYETNQLQNIDKTVLNQFGKLLQNEIDLLNKSEQIRVAINSDQQYNHIAMFNILDAHGNGVIEFSFIEQLMTKAQIPFKPQNFKALTRRAHLLSHNTTLSESLSFEEYKLLASVQCPYFKIPKSPDETTVSNVEYSRILGTEVSGSNSQQLSISRIPNNLQKNSQLYRSKPTIPLYRSCNPYINETIKQQSKTIERNQQSENLQNDYVLLYGTKKEWEELQHSLNVGVGSQSLKDQISRIQHSQISINKVRADSGEKQFERSQIQKIQQQALEEDLDRKQDDLLSKQLQQAMNANTKGYYSNVVKIENERNNTGNTNMMVVQAPWYQNDQKVKNNIDLIRKQQDQIQQLSGVIPKTLPPRPATSPRVPSPLHSQIFQAQQRPPSLMQNKQKIMDYKYQIPERQYDYQN